MKLSGTLIFEPDRGFDFRKQGKVKTLILDLPQHRSTALYYKRLIELKHGPWVNLLDPMFGTHVTVIRGNGDRFDEAACRKLVGKQLTVTVDPETLMRTPWSGTDPAFWYLKVKSDELTKLRDDLGVKPIFSYDPHMTVAREEPLFYMHSRPIEYPVGLAHALLDKIPSNDVKVYKQRGVIYRGGNEALRKELKDFIARAHRDHTCTGEALQALVYNHIRVPVVDWQRELLNLFR